MLKEQYEKEKERKESRHLTKSNPFLDLDNKEDIE